MYVSNQSTAIKLGTWNFYYRFVTRDLAADGGLPLVVVVLGLVVLVLVVPVLVVPVLVVPVLVVPFLVVPVLVVPVLVVPLLVVLSVRDRGRQEDWQEADQGEEHHLANNSSQDLGGTMVMVTPFLQTLDILFL